MVEGKCACDCSMLQACSLFLAIGKSAVCRLCSAAGIAANHWSSHLSACPATSGKDAINLCFIEPGFCVELLQRGFCLDGLLWWCAYPIDCDHACLQAAECCGCRAGGVGCQNIIHLACGGVADARRGKVDVKSKKGVGGFVLQLDGMAIKGLIKQLSEAR